MTTSPRIVLYSANACPWAHRSRIALKAAGAHHEIVEIDLQNKPEWYPQVNPASKVPALWLGGPKDADPTKPPAGSVILPESGAIVEYVASIFPQLYNKDLVRRAQSSLVWLQYDELIAKSWLAYTFSEGGVEVPEYKVFLDNVKKFSSTYLTEEYIGNPEFGVGDILLAPFIEVGGWVKSDAGKVIFDALTTSSDPDFKRFKAYHDKIAVWPAVTETIDLEPSLPELKTKFQAWGEQRRQANGQK